MKKALVLGVAALALVLATACTFKTEEQSDLALSNGSSNYDLAGKTFVRSDTTYWNKITATSVTTGGITTTTTTTELIPYKVETETMTFSTEAIGTYTYTDVIAYAAGIDTKFTDTVTVVGTTVTAVSYETTGGTSVDGHDWTGFAGKQTYSATTNGTWYAYNIEDSEVDAQTKLYRTRWTDSTTSTTTDNVDINGVVAYAAAVVSTSTETNDDPDYAAFTYTRVGKIGGKDALSLNGNIYTIQ